MQRRAIAAILLSCLGVLPAFAATPPKVVFIGDTGGWAPVFAAHPNWINKGNDPATHPTAYFGISDSDSFAVNARFQTDVVSQRPDIVHIMVGFADALRDRDAVEQIWLDQYIQNMTEILQKAKAANIRVILATEPESCQIPKGTIARQVNAWVIGYGIMNSIPVINYDQMLCYPGSHGILPNDNNIPPLFIPTPEADTEGGGFESPAGTITDAGYKQIGLITENTIETLNLTLKSGYLTNQRFDQSGKTTTLNVNAFGASEVIQFTPYGKYSDGGYRAVLNTNLAGASGTWWSSNPAVMSIDQQGNGTALAGGTARIWFQSATGITFSPFDVTVGSICPGTVFCNF